MAEVRKEREAGAETVADGSPSPPIPLGEAVTLAPASAALPAEELPSVPGFEILEELGRGGMGVVYKARQRSLNRLVALKMILAGPYAGADHLARFRLEAEAVARLQHAGIVQIHEIGSHAGRWYLALEYVPGGTLTQRCAGQPRRATEAAQLVEALARAVHYAHKRGILHRDLKPSNVLLTEDGQPKITDFGLAKRLDPDTGTTPSGPQTQSGAILGTPAYMAPEQAGGKRSSVGPAADVYALGAILYELLTGRAPFQADNPLDVILKVATEDPVPPRALVPRCPRDLETVCLTCLRKEPERRYKSAAALADDLRRFLAGEPTEARPMTAGERARRWTWRRRWWLAGGAVMACLLLLLACSLALNALALLWSGRTVVSGSPPEPVAVGSPIEEAVAAPVPLPDDLDLVPRDAVLFLTVRVADLWKRKDVQAFNQELARAQMPTLSDATADFEKVLLLRPGMIRRATLVNLQQAPFPDWFVVILATANPYPREQLEAALTKRGLATRQFQGKTYFGPGPDGRDTVCLHGDRVLVYSPREEWLQEWIARVPPHDDSGPLRPALDLAPRGRHHLVAGTVPPRPVRDQIVRQMQGPFPGLRAEAGLKQPDPRPLVAVRVGTLTADLKSRAEGATVDGLEVDLRLGCTNADAGIKAHEALVGVRDFLAGVMTLFAAGAMEGVPPVIARELALTLRSATVEQRGAEGHVLLKMEWAPSWPAAAVAAVKGEGDRVHSLNNLKQLALAMWAHHDALGHFPPAAITTAAGQPLLSWRMAILPLLGEQKLHKEFRLDEAWDSDHNKKLLARMPAVYAPPLKPAGWQPNTTFYQVFVGEQTLFPPGKKMRVADITDGTTNTLMILEAGEAIPWTRPDDLPYDPARPLPMLGGIFHDGFQAVMADGSSGRFLPKNIPPATLRALITPRGGEKVTLP